MAGGVSYLPLDVHLDDKFELIEAEFGLTGFAVVVKIFQKIYGDDGYYCEWTDEVALLFARRNGVGAGVVSEIVTAAIRRGIFDRSVFEKYHVLTSSGIQKRYLKMTKRRTDVKIKSEYLLIPCAQKSEDVCNPAENVYKNEENVYGERQGKVRESKVSKGKGSTRAELEAKYGKATVALYLKKAGTYHFTDDKALAKAEIWLEEDEMNGKVKRMKQDSFDLDKYARWSFEQINNLEAHNE